MQNRTDECAFYHVSAAMRCGGLRHNHAARYSDHEFVEPGSNEIHDVADVQEEVDRLSEQLAANHAKLTTHRFTVQQIRRVLMDVIDEGDPKREDGHGRFCNRWLLDDPNEEIANEQRLKFASRIQELLVKEATGAQRSK